MTITIHQLTDADVAGLRVERYAHAVQSIKVEELDRGLVYIILGDNVDGLKTAEDVVEALKAGKTVHTQRFTWTLVSEPHKAPDGQSIVSAVFDLPLPKRIARSSCVPWSSIEDSGIVELANGKTYRFVTVRLYDPRPPKGQRVTWDVELHANRRLPINCLPEVRKELLARFKARIEQANADILEEDQATAEARELTAQEAVEGLEQANVAQSTQEAADDDQTDQDGIQSGLTGEDWEPAQATRFFAQKGNAFEFGPSRQEAIDKLKATLGSQEQPEGVEGDDEEFVTDTITKDKVRFLKHGCTSIDKDGCKLTYVSNRGSTWFVMEGPNGSHKIAGTATPARLDAHWRGFRAGQASSVSDPFPTPDGYLVIAGCDLQGKDACFSRLTTPIAQAWAVDLGTTAEDAVSRLKAGEVLRSDHRMICHCATPELPDQDYELADVIRRLAKAQADQRTAHERLQDAERDFSRLVAKR